MSAISSFEIIFFWWNPHSPWKSFSVEQYTIYHWRVKIRVKDFLRILKGFKTHSKYVSVCKASDCFLSNSFPSLSLVLLSPRSWNNKFYLWKFPIFNFNNNVQFCTRLQTNRRAIVDRIGGSDCRKFWKLILLYLYIYFSLAKWKYRLIQM